MAAAPGTQHRADRDRPGRTRLPAAQRRETILRAATEVFAEAGYRGAKVSDVAARVGVTEPVIFQNFGSKAGLFGAVLERAAADIRASLDELATDPASASRLLAHVLAPPGPHPGGTMTRPGEPHPAAGHPGTAYAVLFADAAALTAEPGLSEPALVAIGAVAGHLADLIRRARPAGGAGDDVDPEAASWLLLSVLSARRLRSAAMPARLEPAVNSLALRALAPGTAQRPPVL